MLIDDAFECRGGARVIPRTFRVHDGDGSLLAHAETVCFGAIDAPALREVEFDEAFL